MDSAIFDLTQDDGTANASVDLAHAVVDLSDPAWDLGGAPLPEVERLVFGHSDQVLYSIDPTSLVVTQIGAFTWPFVDDAMTDIAIDRHGDLIGIGEAAVYVVDPSTAKCTYLATLTDAVNGLTFVAGSGADSAETLIAASADGMVYRLDPLTGSQTPIGFYGHNWSSSGDLVSVEGVTYATVISSTSATDLLVTVDPASGAASEIGDTGVSQIWGLGYWKQKLFGFTASSGIVLLDLHSGKATPIPGTESISWWGASVATTAPTD